MEKFSIVYNYIINNITLKYKILLFFLPIIIIPFIFLALYSSKIIADSATNKAIIDSENKMALIARQIDTLTNDIEYSARLFSSNRYLHEAIENRKAEGELGDMRLMTEISNILLSNIYLSDFIKRTIIITSSDEKIYTIRQDTSEVQPNTGISEKEFLQLNKSTLEARGKALWTNFFIGGKEGEASAKLAEEETQLYVSKAIQDTLTGVWLGSIVLSINRNAFITTYKGVKNGKTGKYFIINKYGYVVSNEDNELIGKSVINQGYHSWIAQNGAGEKVFEIEGEKVLVASRPLNKLNWYLVGIVPINELIEDSNRIRTSIILIGLIIMVFIITGSFAISTGITQPISKLVGFTKKIGEGNLEIKVNTGAKGEIRNLEKQMNTMLEKIRELIAKVLYEQRKKREYELSLLQSQIKPHFLYNALNNINSLLLEEKYEQGRNLTYNLGTYYKLALSRGLDIIPIKMEIELTMSYLKIIQIRDEDLFDFKIDIDDSIKQSVIPKLTLQPLVENSIKHGFQGTAIGNMIKINGFKIADDVYIDIEDNGKGIMLYNKSTIFEEKNPRLNTGGFGLFNVNERIKMKFGEEYGLSIKTAREKGTVITIHLPYSEERRVD